MKISNKLEKSREYEVEELKNRKFSEKQAFHLCAPVGWINDPNGFSEFKGEKHLFFQYHPYDTVWGPMHWGHVKSSDFIKWEQLPIAIAPDETYDNFGCFSGSAIEWKGKHVLVYTGVEEVENEKGEKSTLQTQCVAIGNGINYEKISTNPVITAKQVPQGGSKVDFRDPKVWEDDGTIYMVVGNRASDGSGQILLYKTENLQQWEYVGIVDQCLNRYGKMWECPDLFTLNGKDVLLVSPQQMIGKKLEFHAGDGTMYLIGELQTDGCGLQEETIKTIDGGLDFYAPQTMLAADGRRIMVGWMHAWGVNLFEQADGFCGMMTIPRELSLKDGYLYQVPVRELETYYKNRVELLDVCLEEEYVKLDALSGRIQNIEFSIESTEGFILEMKLAANDQYYSHLVYDKENGVLSFDRASCGIRRDVPHTRTISLLSKPEKSKIRILMDRYSIEVFVEDGQRAMTSIIRTPFEADGFFIKCNKKVNAYIVKHDIYL